RKSSSERTPRGRPRVSGRRCVAWSSVALADEPRRPWSHCRGTDGRSPQLWEGLFPIFFFGPVDAFVRHATWRLPRAEGRRHDPRERLAEAGLGVEDEGVVAAPGHGVAPEAGQQGDP